MARTLLVTGFGPFPGSPRNPSAAVVAALARHRGRFARLGLDLRLAVLPVRFEGIEARLAALVGEHRPDAILHLGVAGRRSRICVETRALNRAGPLHPDAAGHCPSPVLAPGGAAMLRASLPARRMAAVLLRHGIGARCSIDAGDYVCNATLYRSLALEASPCGFLHLPRPRDPARPRRPAGARRPAMEDLARAVLLAALALAPLPRRSDLSRQCARPPTAPSAHGGPKDLRGGPYEHDAGTKGKPVFRTRSGDD